MKNTVFDAGRAGSEYPTIVLREGGVTTIPNRCNQGGIDGWGGGGGGAHQNTGDGGERHNLSGGFVAGYGVFTLRILPTSLQIFFYYFAIGLPMAVLPSVVRVQLHFNTVLAGLAIRAQYVATVVSRPQAGAATGIRQ